MMPLTTKYQMAEDLWHHVGPESNVLLKFGDGVTAEQLEATVGQHITSVIEGYKFPVDLQRRFGWLSSGDVDVEQQILNYLRERDKELVVSTSRAKIDIMIDTFFGENSEMVQHYSETLKVGKHQLTLSPDRSFSGQELTDVSPKTGFAGISGVKDFDWVWTVIFIAALALVVWLLNR